ncbi:Major intrinsic protein family and Aquaporin-like domain-containing protein [Strongyloides ratti]|uniref:Major intrinsic protein family and Aquaporin-like domain-containing protein n=1 Tax=Strongyloides ratti TaxID=34506 RepID=A0A090L4V2_STRRB|nr:Major intrinsic protein family and Aquaporin-like domain-containing protein [Strongyloides ratti]CEF62529.1 Major intrinsic protein family and Aquaporin-like domain-containing protein [Strongyloides ratti]
MAISLDEGNINLTNQFTEDMATTSSEISQPTIVNVIQKPSVNIIDRIRYKIGLRNELYRNLIVECFCTGFLCFGGFTSNCQYVLSYSQKNNYLAVTIGWSLSLMFAVYMSFRTSGGHLNPAVSLFQLTMGNINALTFILYSIAQTIGAFFGSLFAYILYIDAIDNYDGGNRFVTGPRATAGIFATYPQHYLSIFGGIFDQVLGTAILCFLIGTITDKRNRIGYTFQPLLIALVLLFIGLTIGMNSGYAINPARDIGPRLFTLIAGYGWRVFSYRNYTWFWIPIFAPLLGGVIGAWMYQLIIGIHLPDNTYEDEEFYRSTHPENQHIMANTYEVKSVDVRNVNPNGMQKGYPYTNTSTDQSYYTERPHQSREFV